MNQFEKILKFRVVLSTSGLDICRRGIKVTACDFAEIAFHVHIFVLGSGVMGTCRNDKVQTHIWLKFGRMPSIYIYGALMVLNFCGNRGWGLGTRAKLLGVSN